MRPGSRFSILFLTSCCFFIKVYSALVLFFRVWVRADVDGAKCDYPKTDRGGGLRAPRGVT